MMGIYYISLFPFNFWQWESYAEKKFILYMLMKFIFEMFWRWVLYMLLLFNWKKEFEYFGRLHKILHSFFKTFNGYPKLWEFIYISLLPFIFRPWESYAENFHFYVLMKFIFETFSENLCHQIIRPFIT